MLSRMVRLFLNKMSATISTRLLNAVTINDLETIDEMELPTILLNRLRKNGFMEKLFDEAVKYGGVDTMNHLLSSGILKSEDLHIYDAIVSNDLEMVKFITDIKPLNFNYLDLAFDHALDVVEDFVEDGKTEYIPMLDYLKSLLPVDMNR